VEPGANVNHGTNDGVTLPGPFIPNALKGGKFDLQCVFTVRRTSILHFLSLVQGGWTGSQPWTRTGSPTVGRSGDHSNLYDLIESLPSCYSLIEMEVDSRSMSHRSEDARDPRRRTLRFAHDRVLVGTKASLGITRCQCNCDTRRGSGRRSKVSMERPSGGRDRELHTLGLTLRADSLL
jgi:hypothetical protein